MTMFRSSDRLECLKLSVAICHRDTNNDPDQMIALAKKLCEYVEGGSPAGNGEEGKTSSPALRKTTVKSG